MVIGTGTGIYATFVMTVVAQEDSSRVVWPSCPSSGWTGGVNTLTSIPNGKPLTTPTKGPRFETHGPYQHGAGIKAVNGGASIGGGPDAGVSMGNIPIAIHGSGDDTTGINKANVFASEFGSSVFSSFESMSPTLAKSHWSVHGGGTAARPGVSFHVDVYAQICLHALTMPPAGMLCAQQDNNPMSQRN